MSYYCLKAMFESSSFLVGCVFMKDGTGAGRGRNQHSQAFKSIRHSQINCYSEIMCTTDAGQC